MPLKFEVKAKGNVCARLAESHTATTLPDRDRGSCPASKLANPGADSRVAKVA